MDILGRDKQFLSSFWVCWIFPVASCSPLLPTTTIFTLGSSEPCLQTWEADLLGLPSNFQLGHASGRP